MVTKKNLIIQYQLSKNQHLELFVFEKYKNARWKSSNCRSVSCLDIGILQRMIE